MGASIRMWRDYFPNAMVTGLDHFTGQMGWVHQDHDSHSLSATSDSGHFSQVHTKGKLKDTPLTFSNYDRFLNEVLLLPCLAVPSHPRRPGANTRDLA